MVPLVFAQRRRCDHAHNLALCLSHNKLTNLTQNCQVCTVQIVLFRTLLLYWEYIAENKVDHAKEAKLHQEKVLVLGKILC